MSLHQEHLFLEPLEDRAMPAVVTPMPAAPAVTPAAVVALPVVPGNVNITLAQTIPQVAALGATGAAASASSPTSPFANPLAAAPAIANLQPGSVALFTPTQVTSFLGDRGVNDAVINRPGGPTVDPFLATARPPADQVTSGFRGRLVFPGTGLQDRSATVPGPLDQPPGTFLVGGREPPVRDANRGLTSPARLACAAVIF
jgi:hypothetical protein